MKWILIPYTRQLPARRMSLKEPGGAGMAGMAVAAGMAGVTVAAGATGLPERMPAARRKSQDA